MRRTSNVEVVGVMPSRTWLQPSKRLKYKLICRRPMILLCAVGAAARDSAAGCGTPCSHRDECDTGFQTFSSVARESSGRATVGQGKCCNSMAKYSGRQLKKLKLSGSRILQPTDNPSHLRSSESPTSSHRTEEPLTGMEAWKPLGVPLAVLRALNDLGFSSPTEIQRQTIPLAIRDGCDIVGAAETGSGKTLAFAVPILCHILLNCRQRREERAGRHSRRKVDKPVRQDEGGVDGGPRQRVIHLNQVIHLSAGLEEETDGEGSESGDDVERCREIVGGGWSTGCGRGGGVRGVLEDSGESYELQWVEEEEESSDEGVKQGTRLKQTSKRVGLISYMDKIPEDVFQRMLAGDNDSFLSATHSPTATTAQQDTTSAAAPPPPHKANIYTYSGSLIALVLAPTRELALQVHTHINNAAKYTGIKVCAVVGGMSQEKQERVLGWRPPIVVATPGRLWKLMSEGDSHLNSLDNLRFLVMDEADRMVEFGHFQELGNILDRVNGAKGAHSRQTFVFSATLTLPRLSTERRRRKRGISREESIEISLVEKLMSSVGLRENTKVVDISGRRGTVDTLTETKIMCTAQEKDVYLYNFLLFYRGRTLVFVNSIDCLQRLRSLLELLGLSPLPLHAHLQQRQRLKNLDRFTSNPDGLLIASDVAARGLDIPQVHHIIHYHIPRNSELYVHRSGRTARARAEGLSVMLVGPEDLKAYRNICKTLNRDNELPNFPVDSSYLNAVRKRVSLAKRIDAAQHKQRKVRKSNDWFVQTAKAMDIEMDEDLLQDDPGSDLKELTKIQSLKSNLRSLLSVPVIPRSVSAMFPTRDENHKLLASIQEASGSTKRRKVVVALDKDALTTAKEKIFDAKKCGTLANNY